MRTEDFDYHLPEDAIAQYPAERGESRLLVASASGESRHRQVRDLPSLLQPGDLLVVNDTKVLPARLFGRRQTETGGRVEILLVERQGTQEWDALLRPGKRQRAGTRIVFEGHDVSAEVLGRGAEGLFRIAFSDPIEPYLETLGHLPLPPYIQRADEQSDFERYQTIYASRPGAVAAPTAGLHFTNALFDQLTRLGVGIAHITLHVGIGTFRPVSAERIEDHEMHSERYEVGAEAADAIRATRAAGGQIVAVGTTVVRTLETIAQEYGEVRACRGRSALFITPGFPYRVTDRLLTNFHLPRSTLLMLVCALGGQEPILACYREAIDRGYRFYSYGDAMLIDRQNPPA